MKILPQIGVIFNLDKCIGCHTCTVACKNIWTNRDGAEYMYWNNVETKPGIGYPKQWEDQDKYKGGWTVKNRKLRLRLGGKASILLNIFWNPWLPSMEDYWGSKGPWTYTYEDLHTGKEMKTQPVARPKSLITGEEDIQLDWGPNWEDAGAGIDRTARLDPNYKKLSPEEQEAYLEYKNVFYFYLPRICNHCLNPACVAACPAGAIYKREEDGVVLIDQNKCRGWRFCVSACPYKKVYFNWRTGKSEKCILCYPRLEAGQAPACMWSCVGRIRYLGVVFYDLDKAYEALTAPDHKLVEAYRSAILDPFDDDTIKEARAQGIPESWIEAAKRSPFYYMAKKWEIALPLHPEFRTFPMVWYVPPLSPVQTVMEKNGYSTPEEWLPKLDELRIPMKYLANLLAAGNEEEVKKALRRLIALRIYRRSLRVEGKPNVEVLEKVGLTVSDAKRMYRLLALAYHHERFALPTTHTEKATVPYMHQGFAGFTEKMPKKEWHKQPVGGR